VTHPYGADVRLLKVNVGFLLKESAGYVRDIVFDEPGPVHAYEVVLRDLQGTLRLTRTPQGILVQGLLNAKSASECVRCLRPIDLPFQVELSELFVIPTAPEASQAQYQIDEGNFIDLMPILREEGILAIPMHAVCSADCKGLCSQCGKDLNEGPCDCETEEIDPRLSILRTLLDDQ